MVYSYFVSGSGSRLFSRQGFCRCLFQITFIAAFSALCPLHAVRSEQTATAGARLGEGFKVGGKLAIRVVTAAIKGALLFVYLFYQFTATLGTFGTGLNLIGFGMFTFGIADTGEKLPETSAFNGQGFTTLGARFFS